MSYIGHVKQKEINFFFSHLHTYTHTDGIKYN